MWVTNLIVLDLTAVSDQGRREGEIKWNNYPFDFFTVMEKYKETTVEEVSNIEDKTEI